MSGDSLVFDMSQMTEGSPSVFVKRDWLNIQDQQNGNYGGNQLVIDTSQLANSNKYMAYREAYLTMPLTLAVTAPIVDVSAVSETFTFDVSGSSANVIGPLSNAISQGFTGATTTLIGLSPTDPKIVSISEDGKYVLLDKSVSGISG